MVRKFNKKKFNKKKGRAMRRGYNSKAKYPGYVNSGKVGVIMPITLKPKQMVRKVVYNNLIAVRNQVAGTAPSTSVTPQFMVMNLNSPWLINSLINVAPGSSTWVPNRDLLTFTNGSNPTSGTYYPGVFDLTNSPGNTYRQQCVIGSKVTLTYTPVENATDPDSQPTAFFGAICTGPSGWTSANININKIYDAPYSKVSKIIGFGNGTSGNVNKVSKAGFLQFKYSPKKFNMVKDIQDTKSLWSGVASGSGTHPSEIDRLVVGITPLIIGDDTRALVSGVLQIRVESTMLFAEPDNLNNFGPEVPIGSAIG